MVDRRGGGTQGTARATPHRRLDDLRIRSLGSDPRASIRIEDLGGVAEAVAPVGTPSRSPRDLDLVGPVDPGHSFLHAGGHRLVHGYDGSTGRPVEIEIWWRSGTNFELEG